MRHTLVEVSPGWWRWTYSRGEYFGSGCSETRRQAIRHLLDERKQASEFSRVYTQWMNDLRQSGAI